MKKTTKLFSLLLALAMTVSLAACGGGGESSTASGGESSTGSSGSTEADAPTFTVATVRWTDAWPTDYLESGVMKEIEEQTGVNIDWQVYYNGDWAEQKSLLLASGDLPDAFWGSLCLSDTDVNQNKSNLVELTDLIAENMPNLNRVFETDASMKAIITDRNGEIYSLPRSCRCARRSTTSCTSTRHGSTRWASKCPTPMRISKLCWRPLSHRTRTATAKQTNTAIPPRRASAATCAT